MHLAPHPPMWFVMSKGHGYPLPSGELGEDEIVCQLIYLPNRDEYWQAFFSAYHYMTNWLAWERDAEKRGKDAAANWREAFELTMECWRMTCLDEITERMDIMIDLLGNQPGCCGTTTIGPIITVITTLVPGVGDDPTEWGETEVADWDEWSEYVCYHAHVYVDSLINSATVIDIAIELGSFTHDFFVGVMRFLQYLGLDQMLGLNQVMMVYDAFRAEEDMSGWFTPLAERFEDARQQIVCSIMLGESLSDAVETAIDDNVVWLLFYVLTDYDAVQALIYEGTADGIEYLPPVKKDDCVDCVPTIPEGVSSWPIEIISVSSPQFPGAQWTVHEFTTDGVSMFLDVTNETGGGAVIFVDLLVGPSPYWGVSGVGHQGIAYDGVRYTDYGQVISCESGFLHETGEIGEANNDRWYLACSNPYPLYDEDLETYMGISWYAAGGTSGLDQDPDQNRTLRIRYWAKSGPPAGTRFQCYVEGLHWAYYKT